MSGGGVRRAGVLAHLSTLPGAGDHGRLGNEAFAFVDWLAAGGFSAWQLLPLGPTHADGSPYGGLSVHAGDPRYLAPTAERGASGGGAPGRAQGDGAANSAAPQYETSAAERAAWCERHRYWLDDFALYSALRAEKQGAPWWEWPPEERDRQSEALAAARQRLAVEIEQVVAEQWQFFHQWAALRAHAARRGIALIGDMPLFVAHDSADVWAHRELFQLAPDGQAQVVAGVPPDYFSASGQRWGNPLYNWSQIEADGFRWWLERIATQLELFDWVRLDHFRGLAACWAIPAEHDHGRMGEWQATPGRALLEAVGARFGWVPFVAEDLGLITDEVVALRDDFALPGMKVLQFAFDGGADNPYLPHNHTEQSLVYTGTHDNDTTVGWYHQLSEESRGRVDDYLGHSAEPMPWPLIRCALASVSAWAIVPLQDLLELDSAHRMNTPGTVHPDNWRWRFSWAWLPERLPERMAALNALYGRRL